MDILNIACIGTIILTLSGCDAINTKTESNEYPDRYQVVSGKFQDYFYDMKGKSLDKEDISTFIKLDTFTGKTWIFERKFIINKKGEINTNTDGWQLVRDQ